jgi:beta-catenin-like protein 1
MGQDAHVMSWLSARISRKETPVTQNKQYAAEVLAILLQSSSKNRKKYVGLNGVDNLLQLLSVYRKRDPERDSDEEEYVENLFDCLTCIVDEDEGKDRFVEGEGIELAQIMLREGKLSKQRSLRVLDHALSGQSGVAACERLIEAAGLRTVFGMFMKKVGFMIILTNDVSANSLQQENEAIEHLLGIFASLLRLLPGGSASRIRTLAKFMEKDYEKIEKLIKLRREYAARLSPVEQAIEKERRSLDEEEQEEIAGGWLSRRLDAGLFSLQV